MKTHGIAALAVVSALVLASPVLACEMHKDGHASLTTAKAEPVPVPVQKPAVDTRALSVSKPAEQPAMSSMNQGYSGCERMRHTVYLTN